MFQSANRKNVPRIHKNLQNRFNASYIILAQIIYYSHFVTKQRFLVYTVGRPVNQNFTLALLTRLFYMLINGHCKPKIDAVLRLRTSQASLFTLRSCFPAKVINLCCIQDGGMTPNGYRKMCFIQFSKMRRYRISPMFYKYGWKLRVSALSENVSALMQNTYK